MMRKDKILVAAIIVAAIAIMPAKLNGAHESTNDGSEKKARSYVCSHEDVEWHRTIEPTCNTEGKAVAICLECNSMVREQILEKIAHPVEYITAITEEDGSSLIVERAVCEICDLAE